jgi:hypothetical protein
MPLWNESPPLHTTATKDRIGQGRKREINRWGQREPTSKKWRLHIPRGRIAPAASTASREDAPSPARFPSTHTDCSRIWADRHVRHQATIQHLLNHTSSLSELNKSRSIGTAPFCIKVCVCSGGPVMGQSDHHNYLQAYSYQRRCWWEPTVPRFEGAIHALQITTPIGMESNFVLIFLESTGCCWRRVAEFVCHVTTNIKLHWKHLPV